MSETLRKHKARHEAKGNGFGYEIREWNGIAVLLYVEEWVENETFSLINGKRI